MFDVASAIFLTHAALAMKNVSYEYKAINLINGEGDQVQHNKFISLIYSPHFIMLA